MNDMSKPVGYGLIVGKFRPLHKGHMFLIEEAIRQSESLTIVVIGDDSDGEPDVIDRLNWLRDLYEEIENVDIFHTWNDVPDTHEGWADKTLRTWGKPDAVFTSEEYGDGWAQALGCKHICIDLDRTKYPISGSQILKDPMKWFSFLSPPAKAYYAKRIYVVGAESTGKTTLAKNLAKLLNTVWVPEYGRVYWDAFLSPEQNANTLWSDTDWFHVASSQLDLENNLARHANKVIICDTDYLTTAHWKKRWNPGSKLDDFWPLESQAAAFVISDISVPWEDDGTRSKQDEKNRFDFHKEIVDRVQRSGVPIIQAYSSTGPKTSAELAFEVIERTILRG